MLGFFAHPLGVKNAKFPNELQCERAFMQTVPKMREYRFPSIYQRSLRSALIFQVLGIVLTGFVMDTGWFAFVYVVGSAVLWALVGILVFARQRPTKLERLLIGFGPILLFSFMFFFL